MSRVVVLLQNEFQRSPFLNDLGQDKSLLGLCRMPTQAELARRTIFIFETFSLMTKDQKLDDYIKAMDGLIIIMDVNGFSEAVKDRLVEIMRLVPFMPVLFIFERYTPNPLATDPTQWLNDFTVAKYRTVFFFEHQQIPENQVWKFMDPLESRETYQRSTTYQMEKAKEWFNHQLSQHSQSQPAMKVAYNSLTMPMDQMVNLFMNLTLPLSVWDHYGRLRIVHYALITHGYEDCINSSGWLCSHWRQYKASIGHDHHWHYTLTRFWVEIIRSLVQRNPKQTFQELYQSNPQIQRGQLFRQYYSDNVLFNDLARNQWIGPNLAMLPG